jgi:hypothetical protein
VKAKGTVAWKLATRGRVSSGRYAIAVRVTDAAGNRSRPKQVAKRLRG